MSLDRDTLLDIYTRTMKVARFDEKMRSLLMSGKLATIYYTMRGQELVTSAMMARCLFVSVASFNALAGDRTTTNAPRGTTRALDMTRASIGFSRATMATRRPPRPARLLLFVNSPTTHEKTDEPPR